MPKGTPLDPSVVEGIGELYARLGNLSGVARMLNLPFETVRDVIARGSNARRRQLLEAALALGLEEGAEHLRECAAKARDGLINAAATPERVDPKGEGEGLSGSNDLRNYAQSLAALVGTQARVRDSIERARNGAVARRRAEAQIELAKAQVELVRVQTAKLSRGDDGEGGEVHVTFVCEPAPTLPEGAVDGRGGS